MKISSSTLPPPDVISDACAKYYKPLSKKKKKPIDTEAIGTPTYNLLLDLLRCQVKHPNNAIAKDNGGAGGSDAKKCVNVEKMYSACHAAVMGVGNYKGRKNCGDEMERLFSCVNNNMDGSLPS